MSEFFISQFIFCNSVLFAFTNTRYFAILPVRRRTPNEKHQPNLGAEADGAITWPG
jgi:predicted secreted protein